MHRRMKQAMHYLLVAQINKPVVYMQINLYLLEVLLVILRGRNLD